MRVAVNPNGNTTPRGILRPISSETSPGRVRKCEHPLRPLPGINVGEPSVSPHVPPRRLKLVKLRRRRKISPLQPPTALVPVAPPPSGLNSRREGP